EISAKSSSIIIDNGIFAKCSLIIDDLTFIINNRRGISAKHSSLLIDDRIFLQA
ncbi:33705_t:CDS:1, partial [Gigaspora margarita]